MWIKKKECKDIMEAAWKNSVNQNTPNGMAERLNLCAVELNKWNVTTFGKVPKLISNKRKAFDSMVSRDIDGSLEREINNLRRGINDLLDSEENMWQQRAKVQWLGLSDRNTKYFHTKASKRKEKNTILGLEDEEGNWRNSKEDIADIAVSYFEKMYTTSYPFREAEVIATIPTRIIDEMNQFLIKEFTKEEVEEALKQMHPTKAPGPDGMSTIFFQKY